MGAQQATVTTEEYCRQIEAYLCRKNDGHLIRIVGPSFERVCGWASQGVPFKVACEGIDRYFERYYAKGPRRRPVHIDFCEADVLDVFDAWRRAVGVSARGEPADPDDTAGRSSRTSLPAHLDRLCERLTARRAGLDPPQPLLDAVLDQTAAEVASLRDNGGPFRGEVRERALARLAELDRHLLDAARGLLDREALDGLRREAEEQLQPFRERMPADSYERAVDAVVDRLIRARERLPLLAFE